MRVPVISSDEQPLMPTKPSRARGWVREGKAKGFFKDLSQYCVQLLEEPTGTDTQSIAVGVDPGKKYSGLGVQSANYTLWKGHLILPFETVKKRMEQPRMMRRGRRGRRINRKLPYKQRAHRQKRFNHRRGHKLPASIRANRQLEYRVVKELTKVYPICAIYYEYVEAKGDKAFTPVMVGEKFMLQWLEKLAPTHTKLGWETASLRRDLKLEKSRNQGESTPASHAVDGIALASHSFRGMEKINGKNYRGQVWQGEVNLTESPFTVLRRPPVSRRQLHLMVEPLGGVRRKYGGTVTRHGFCKGDYVQASRKDQAFFGWVSGDTKSQVSVSNANWKRLGQFSTNKIRLLKHSTNLVTTAKAVI